MVGGGGTLISYGFVPAFLGGRVVGAAIVVAVVIALLAAVVVVGGCLADLAGCARGSSDIGMGVGLGRFGGS